MGGKRLQGLEKNGDSFSANSGVKFSWCRQDKSLQPGGLFASVGQIGISPNSPNLTDKSLKLACSSLNAKYMPVPEPGFQIVEAAELMVGEVLEVREEGSLKKKKKGGLRLKIKIGHASLRRLSSGGIAGAISRTIVAPLETIRTHLMVGRCGHSTTEVFQNIMNSEGWTGLFRGNLVNVIRVAPSKAIEVDCLGFPLW